MSVPKEIISEGLTFEEKNKVERKDNSLATKSRTEPIFLKDSAESDTSHETIKVQYSVEPVTRRQDYFSLMKATMFFFVLIVH
mgnify:CR=1 FL=1